MLARKTELMDENSTLEERLEKINQLEDDLPGGDKRITTLENAF